uniref:7TM_GPCR_Srx domain-containing protein n=1 Tax=Caenorhabditis tropicalis TaxID=1561998 RepID=A0A1I7U3P1_9PELO
MFHQNFIILAIPMFGLWYEVIIGKLITMAFQMEFLTPKFNKFYELWTINPDEMLKIESSNGLELLIFAGFIEWHYLFSVIFGAIAHCIERTIASVLIE